MANQNSSGADIFPITCNKFTNISVEAVGACGTSAQTSRSIKVPCNGGGALAVTPNPASTIITVSAKTATPQKAEAQTISSFNEVRIFDFQGRLMKYQPVITSGQATLNIADLKEGIYFIEVSNGTVRQRQEFMIKR
jgi:hypothetical protein